MLIHRLTAFTIAAFSVTAVPAAFAEDCDKDGIEDAEAIAEGLVPDCNANGVPDYCDIWLNFTSGDCNNNGIPDDCETDCNENNVPDDCDILNGVSADADGNRVPDDCQSPPEFDCNANGIADAADIRNPLDFSMTELPFGIDHSGFALNPIDLAVGDMNGDNRPDIVSANRSFPLGRSVGVFLALPAGGFAPGAIYNGGMDAEGVGIGDLDGDGDLDVAVSVRRTPQNGIDVFLNDGNGVLAPHAQLNVGSYLIDVQIADVTGDGVRDIVAADINGSRVAVVRNLGGAAFSAPAYYTVGNRPLYVAIGLFNADALNDIAVSVQGDGGRVVMLLNSGAGFASGIVYPVPENEGGGEIEAGDFDDDGNLDVVVIQQTYKRVCFYAGDGAGGLAAPVTSQGPADNLVALTSADLDGDGRLDVAVSTSSGFFPNGDPRPGFACVMSGVGDGTFLGPECWLAGDSPLSIAAGNLDADTKIDLAVGAYQNEVVRVFTNETGPALSVDANTNGIPDECECPTDFNDDGRTDLADLSILLAAFGGPGTPSTGDATGDGQVDLTDLSLVLTVFGSDCD